jgi:diguanylate cyclase
MLSRSISAGLETLDAIMQSESPDIQAHAKLEDSLNTVRLSLDSFLEMQQRQRQDYEQRIAELTNQVSSFELESARLRESLAAEHARAHRDTLTDTPNRLAYEERAELEIMRARRNDSPLCLAVFDLDHFKLVNDRFGHRVGDRLLRSVASIAVHRVRGTDLFARYGGEEFVGVFPDTSLEDVATLCDDLRERIASAAFQFRGEVISMTVSIGLSALRPDDSLESLFERADAALYRAKEAGRNRLVREA